MYAISIMMLPSLAWVLLLVILACMFGEKRCDHVYHVTAFGNWNVYVWWLARLADVVIRMQPQACMCGCHVMLSSCERTLLQ